MPETQKIASFAPGSSVVEIHNPGRIGITTARTQAIGGSVMQEVVWGPSEKEYVPVPLLRAFAEDCSDMDTRVRDGNFGGAEDFRRLLTFEKLKGTLHDFLYSMEAAGIDFLEYQFKPALKFIESPTERLLIADEVGLGKTIEAALIWLELRARKDAKRLLVVCPKMLAKKWRAELREKFNVPAEVCSFSQLRQSYEDFRAEGPNLRFAWICTYTGLRPSKADVLALEDLDTELSERGEFLRRLHSETTEAPFLDLAIFDEAHNMRNSGAAQSRLGTVLGGVSSAMLLVSATPVNNSNRDLFTLLRLLDADFFENEKLFNILLEENRPAVRALMALSKVPPNIPEARECARELGHSQFIGKSALLARFSNLLSQLNEPDPNILVDAQGMAERLNILGSYISRTRRSQVKEKQPLRDPHVVPVKLTPTERQFYDAITHMVRVRVAQAGSKFSAFHLVMPQQRMASCIPAMVEAYRRGDLGDVDELLSESFDFDDDDLFDFQKSEEPEDFSECLEEFRTYDFEANDSKFQKLREQLLKPLKGEKVIIFSYFKGTLFYLRRRLEAEGLGCAAIHGDILDQDEREAEIARFREDPAVTVLLSSEVGSEGIDLQFCHNLVNYDLPWNPMRVEQRIGRIDRVGQEANRLVIVHFKIVGTIEERLYDRLHSKLLAFQNSIGDLESVIGKEVQELTLDLLKQELTPEEEEARIIRTEQALTRRLKDAEELEKSGESLVAHADYIASKVDRNRDLGRFVSPEEIHRYIQDFFDNSFPGCRLQWDYPITGTFRLELTFQAHDSFTDFLHAQRLETPPELQARIITGTLLPALAKQKKMVTQRRLILINHLSPLIRWITHQNQLREGAFYDVSALTLQHPEWEPGIYAYHIQRWKLKGLRSREVLAYGCAPVTGKPLSPTEAEKRIHQLLATSTTWRHPDHPKDEAMQTIDMLRESLRQRFEAMHDEFGVRNAAQTSIKKAQIENHFQRRRELDERRIATAVARGRPESRINMFRRSIANDAELAAKRLRDLERDSTVRVNFQEVALGIFRVEEAA